MFVDNKNVKSILFTILKAHTLYNNSTGDKDLISFFVDMCDGDDIKGYILYLMGHDQVLSDLQDLATYYGIGFRNKTNPGNVVSDIPPAPSTAHRWNADTERWKKQKCVYESGKIKNTVDC